MPPMLDDRQLVARAQGGDPEAFSQLVERHQTMVYRLALGKTGSPQDAEEVTQTAFLKAWQGLRTFQEKAAFSTWLYRLTANAAVDLLRRRREPALSLDDPDQAPSPEELSMAAERRRLLWQAIDQLPESHRLPLVLRELEGLSYREIARALDLEEGTVKSRLARGRLMLRQQLLESGTFYPTQAAEAPAGKGGRRK